MTCAKDLFTRDGLMYYLVFEARNTMMDTHVVAVNIAWPARSARLWLRLSLETLKNEANIYAR